MVGGDGASALDIANLARKALDPEFREIVSTLIHRRKILRESTRDERAIFAEYKYLSRISTRCTPYGWSVITSFVKFGAGGLAEEGPTGRYFQAIDIDKSILVTLCRNQRRNVVISGETPVSLNPTLFKCDGKFRYYNFTGQDSGEAYELATVVDDSSASVVVEATLRHEVCRADELCELLMEREQVEFEEALTYLGELASSGVLYAGPRPTVNSPTSTSVEIGKLAVTTEDHELAMVAELAQQVARNSKQKASQTICDINAALAAKLPCDPKQWVVNCHAYREGVAATYSDDLLDDVESVLAELTPHFYWFNADLFDFHDAFLRKFGEAPVPLLLAIDQEYGIDLKDVKTRNSSIRTLDQLLVEKMCHALKENLAQVSISKDELPKDEGSLLHNWIVSQTGTVQLELLHDFPNSSSPSYHLQGVTLGSPQRFYSRFLPHHRDVWETLSSDDRFGDDGDATIYADVQFLAEGRMANVTGVVPSHQHAIICDEISPPRDCIPIALSDLVLQSDGNKLRLFSTKLQKPVVPVFNHPFNTDLSLRPAIAILGMFSRMTQPTFYFSWPGLLTTSRFLPRVTYRSAILSLATWRLDLSGLKNMSTVDAIGHLRSELSDVPRFFSHGMGDKFIVYDKESDLALRCFLKEARYASHAEIRESLINERYQAVSCQPINQLHIPFRINQLQAEPITALRTNVGPKGAIHRPGAQWATLKIYINQRSMPDFIAGELSRLVGEILDERCKWFFIRYRDPKPHIRLRIHGPSSHLWAITVPSVLNFLNSDATSLRINDVVLEPYVPELHRYGQDDRIDNCEDIFCADSARALTSVTNFLQDRKVGIETVTLLHLHHLLEWLGVDPNRRIKLLRVMGAGADRSFAASYFAAKKSSMQHHFRTARFAREPRHPQYDDSVLSSILHMAVNRVSGVLPKKHESAIYNLLMRWYMRSLMSSDGV